MPKQTIALLTRKTFEEAREIKYVAPIERMAKQDARIATQTEIALNMLRKHLDVETIAEVTGLSIAQIQPLQGQPN